MKAAEGLLYLTASDLQRLGLTISRVADVLEDAFRHKAAGRVTMPPMTFFHREGSQWFNSMVCWIAPLAFAGCLRSRACTCFARAKAAAWSR